MDSLEQLHDGGTVVCMMWTLARGRSRVKNESDSHKQAVTMASDHFALKLKNIHVFSAKFSQLRQDLHAP